MHLDSKQMKIDPGNFPEAVNPLIHRLLFCAHLYGQFWGARINLQMSALLIWIGPTLCAEAESENQLFIIILPGGEP